MLRIILTSITLLCFSNLLFAQITNWIGGSGNWHDPSHWSGGNVPNFSETASIDCNCKVVIDDNIIAEAGRVIIRSGSLLGIQRRGTLNIEASFASGIDNEGEVSTNGTINIVGTTSGITGIVNRGDFNTSSQATIILNSMRMGIDNHSSFITGADLIIEDVSGFSNLAAIRNSSGGYFYNNRYGDIYLRDIGCNGITNLANFVNSGDIYAQFGLLYEGILNLATFTNNSSGRVIMDSFNENGSSSKSAFKNTSGGFLDNRGRLSISTYSGVGYGIHNNGGDITNTASGLIAINGGTGISQALRFVGPGREFINEGELSIDLDGSGRAVYIYSSTTFTNRFGAEFNISGSSTHGIYLRGDLNNNGGEITENKNSGTSIYISSGDLHNYNCGVISLRQPMTINYSLFLNEAWLDLSSVNSANQNINAASSLWNEGLVYDPLHTMSSVATPNFPNAGMYIRPITGGPYVSGQTVYSPLIYPSNNDVGVNNSWYFPNGQQAGNFSYSNNRLYLNYNGSPGYDELYVDFEIDGCNRRTYSIPVPNGLYRPAIEGGGLAGAAPSMTEGIQVYPNPVVETANVLIPAQMTGDVKGELYSLSGQLILNQTWQSGAQQLARPTGLPGGSYLLRLTDENGVQLQQRLVFQ